MLRMDRNQYDFSNMFWDDPDYDITDGIPKYYEMKGEEMVFNFLSEEETKTFMKMKARENPEVMKDIRYKKMMRILKIN